MKQLLMIILLCISVQAFAQNGITFDVEELSKPDSRLGMTDTEEIYKRLIRTDHSLSSWDINKQETAFEYDIIARSASPDSLVGMGYRSFLRGMHYAYADHRPFVLSPDMIWLLISQGFARHVSANPEKLRKYFVDFSGKKTLEVVSDLDLMEHTEQWESIFSEFTAQISEYTGKEIITTLTPNFSTTTSVEKIASQITVMEAMESYFEFVAVYLVCGIPRITLLGTPEDWQRLLSKTERLAKYDLQWWTRELIPVLIEFVNASKGSINKDFWRDMFKIRTVFPAMGCGSPSDVIDGWIAKFFPYSEEGKRNTLISVNPKDLPNEIVKVNLKYIKTDGSKSETTDLELWSGFIGLEQNEEDFTLTPQIGWMIRKKNMNKEFFSEKLNKANVPLSIGSSYGIELKVSEVPEVLKSMRMIYSLELIFDKKISIPEWMKDIEIGRLVLSGKIAEEEIDKLISWFPKTELTINNERYNSGVAPWVVSQNESVLPEGILDYKKIWILEIPFTRSDENVEIPEALKDIQIDIVSFKDTPTKETLNRIKTLLPDTRIFIGGMEQIRGTVIKVDPKDLVPIKDWNKIVAE